MCQTGCHKHQTRDFCCPKSAGEAKASLHGAQPWATDGLILQPALRVWVSLTESVAMPRESDAVAVVILAGRMKSRGHH